MQIEVIRTAAELQALAAEWNALLAESACNYPFLRHEYLTAWQQTRGGGEWPQLQLFTLIARRPDRSLAGIAPLFFTDHPAGTPALMLLGSINVSDYLDFITRPADLPAFIQAVVAFLAAAPEPAWKTLDLYNLLENSPSLPLLTTEAEACGWHVSQMRMQPCPYVPLPGDWEAYLGTLKKKQRHEIRRKLRRAETHPEPVRWYIFDQPADLDREIEAFHTLMTNDPDKDRFLTPAMRAQSAAAMRAAWEHGWLQLAFLEVGEKKAAAYLNLDYGGQILVYNSGHDLDFGELSPGWVLLAHLLQWANENGRTMLDFMRGAEDYKYRFGAVDRFITRLTITRA
ncbi:MAG TPA: GNAT family N-acetyltransferase [Anaerolineales bacterium]|nr:GNAT family N-acetyltransferase [Anaerolineales bacterium]